MTSAYPEAVPQWFNPGAEEAMKIVLECVHAARSFNNVGSSNVSKPVLLMLRSLRADYRVDNKVKAEFCFRSESEEIFRAVSEQVSDS